MADNWRNERDERGYFDRGKNEGLGVADVSVQDIEAPIDSYVGRQQDRKFHRRQQAAL